MYYSVITANLLLRRVKCQVLEIKTVLNTIWLMDLIGIDWIKADDCYVTWNFRQQDAVNDAYGILMNWTHIVSCHLWTKCMFLPLYRC